MITESITGGGRSCFHPCSSVCQQYNSKSINYPAMEDMAPVAGKLKPPAINRTTMNNKGLKQTSSQEARVECTNTNQEISPPKKRKSPSETSALDSADSFEATAASASSEVSMLISKFAEALSERAAADTSQMEELEVILTEARNLETSLKEKKNHLRQTLALISDKLQG